MRARERRTAEGNARITANRRRRHWLKVPKADRNKGYSFGLEYPFVYGPRPRTAQSLVWDCWTIWHRHTGRVVWRTRERNPAIARGWAMHKCLELNGNPAPDLAAIDSAP